MVTPAFASEINASGNTGESLITATVAAATMSVIVPMELPISIDSEGAATYATDAKIVNKSHGPVIVDNVAVTGQNGWEIANYADSKLVNSPVGTKKIGFQLNGCNTTDYSPNLAGITNAIGAISGGSEAALTYAAKLPAQAQAIDNVTVAKVVFTVDWDAQLSVEIAITDASGNPVNILETNSKYRVELVTKSGQDYSGSVTWDHESLSAAWVSPDDSIGMGSLVGDLHTGTDTGTSWISATLDDQTVYTLNVTITNKVTALNSSYDGVNSEFQSSGLKLGEQVTLYALPQGSSGTPSGNIGDPSRLQWESSDESILSIDSTSNWQCVVKGNAAGNVTVTARYGDLHCEFYITVG